MRVRKPDRDQYCVSSSEIHLLWCFAQSSWERVSCISQPRRRSNQKNKQTKKKENAERVCCCVTCRERVTCWSQLLCRPCLLRAMASWPLLFDARPDLLSALWESTAKAYRLVVHIDDGDDYEDDPMLEEMILVNRQNRLRRLLTPDRHWFETMHMEIYSICHLEGYVVDAQLFCSVRAVCKSWQQLLTSRVVPERLKWMPRSHPRHRVNYELHIASDAFPRYCANGTRCVMVLFYELD